MRSTDEGVVVSLPPGYDPSRIIGIPLLPFASFLMRQSYDRAVRQLLPLRVKL